MNTTQPSGRNRLHCRLQTVQGLDDGRSSKFQEITFKEVSTGAVEVAFATPPWESEYRSPETYVNSEWVSNAPKYANMYTQTCTHHKHVSTCKIGKQSKSVCTHTYLNKTRHCRDMNSQDGGMGRWQCWIEPPEVQAANWPLQQTPDCEEHYVFF